MAPRRLEFVRHVRPQQLDCEPGTEFLDASDLYSLPKDRLALAFQRGSEGHIMQQLNRVLPSGDALSLEVGISLPVGSRVSSSAALR
jgi:hypothetical protein